jgi:penicillin amidase
MKWMKRLFFLLVFLAIAYFAVPLFLPYLNDYQEDGELTLPGLEKSVTVKRDEKGMAYIYADNLHDAIMAQGFVAAQDRLFQMQLTRLFAQAGSVNWPEKRGEHSIFACEPSGFMA